MPYLKRNTRVGVLFTIEGYASLAALECQWEKSLKLFAWATKTRQENGEFRPPVEQVSIDRDMAILRVQLSDAEFAKLEAKGSTMAMEQAIDLALEDQHAPRAV